MQKIVFTLCLTGLDCGDFLLTEGCECCCYRLHSRAVEFAEGLEVRFDLLGDETDRVGYELHLLHIDL